MAIRTLHLVDIENLVEGHWLIDPLTVLAQYRDQAAWNEGDLSYVAAGPKMLKRVCFAATGAWCQWLCRRGKDGADLALLDSAPAAFVADRFDRLVIGSGDWIFAGLAGECRRKGVAVDVIAPSGSLSFLLYRAASSATDFRVDLTDLTQEVTLAA
jgi:hypothetical protein